MLMPVGLCVVCKEPILTIIDYEQIVGSWCVGVIVL